MNTHMIVMVNGHFQYRRIAEHRLMQDYDFKIRRKPVPELNDGEVLSVVLGQSVYRIVRHED